MVDQTKILLSADELGMVSDTTWHIRKRVILQKVESMLAEMPLYIDGYFSSIMSRHNPYPPPKISRGDNYNGLPYLVLDHPRIFQKDNIFALRTMFWWGKQLSVTLHLSGSFNELYLPAIREKFRDDLFMCAAGEEEWDHDVNGRGYAKLAQQGQLLDRRFNKIATAMDIALANDAPSFFRDSYRKIAGILV